MVACMNRKSVLNLFFPQWQGAGNIRLYEGAKQLYASLPSKAPFVEVPVSSAYSMAVTENILNLSQVSHQLNYATDIISEHNPERIFTLGGDCGVEIAPISFLNKKHSGIAVIWLDAHGDLNTPASSPSKTFHGMPLRSLLGQGNAHITSQLFATLVPRQIFLVGTRELDKPEQTFISQNGLRIFSASSVDKCQNGPLLSAIDAAGFRKIYIHLDLDVLEPTEFPDVACRTPGGISVGHLEQLLSELVNKFEVVGSSVLEFMPTKARTEGRLVAASLAGIIQP